MKAAPFGSWQSPISAQMVAAGTLQFSEVKLVGDKIYWLEGRPSEGGRTTLMSCSQKEGEKDLLPKEYIVRSRVHEYGGGALLVAGNLIYFSNDKDKQLYCLQPDGKIRKITSNDNARFADGCVNPIDSTLFYVMESHEKQVLNSIVKIDPIKCTIHPIASGHDFYSNPRVSPNGRYLAYLAWDHPNMPWDGTELWVLDLNTKEQRLVAGGTSESIVDPQWSPDGQLYYISDRTKWWNIYRENQKQPLWKKNAEFALPQWIFGRSLMGFTKDGLFCSYVENGVHSFAQMDASGVWEHIMLPYTAVRDLQVANDRVALIASSPNEPNSIILYDLRSRKSRVIKCCRRDVIDKDLISKPTAIEYPTSHDRTSHAFYYPPCNSKFCGMPNEKPPLLVLSHGGPTSHVSTGFSPEILYWTSRGFAVINVNYGGSTGYGRHYRDSLKGMWGIVDVDDCTNAALFCVDQGLADRNRLAIQGASAGGFTTLAVLAFRDVFHVGADYFGVSDLERLALDTHKFEARYLDQLIGPYPADKATYYERSPIYSVDKIRCPIIILQGDEDLVVPPAQSEEMFNSLKKRKIPTAYLLFQGEQHGFRKAENIQRALEAQLYFFSKILHFPLSDKIEPVPIPGLH